LSWSIPLTGVPCVDQTKCRRCDWACTPLPEERPARPSVVSPPVRAVSPARSQPVRDASPARAPAPVRAASPPRAASPVRPAAAAAAASVASPPRRALSPAPTPQPVKPANADAAPEVVPYDPMSGSKYDPAAGSNYEPPVANNYADSTHPAPASSSEPLVAVVPTRVEEAPPVHSDDGRRWFEMWQCPANPQCNARTFLDRPQCYKCGTARPAQGDMQIVHMWKCSDYLPSKGRRCDWLNFAVDATCRNCGVGGRNNEREGHHERGRGEGDRHSLRGRGCCWCLHCDCMFRLTCCTKRRRSRQSPRTRRWRSRRARSTLPVPLP
jgi:hypothetical protein